MYEKLAGMTGTALTEAEEFAKIYELEVLPIPTNLDYLAERPDADLIAQNAKDEYGYEYVFYTREGLPQKHPLFWKRKDYPDVVYRTEEAKLRAVVQEIVRFHVIGRPQLVGTTSVEHSDRLSNRLSTENLRQLMQVLLIRQTWLDMNGQSMIDRTPPELKPLSRSLDELRGHDLRQIAKDAKLNLPSLEPLHAENLPRLLRALDLKPEHAPRLEAALRGGIPHEVLNARKHDTEAQIIAGAGAFGAVTIATNMAGRGVDIKLGGDLYEEIIQDINTHVLRGIVEDPFDMNHAERVAALKRVEDYGIYEEQVQAYLDYVDKMDQVRTLGGLHVIGTERHEARRIDNQLRGRAARQGDPGSSRFYLSLEDELMRLFGGQQVEALWGRMALDDSLPIEMRILGRIVEQSQERVEGNNFDIRKHLLEYDDVLNSQRQRIYDQRDRVFDKEDLSEDVLDMLRGELQERVLIALADEEGPWKLLGYLNDVQPPIQYEDTGFASFTYRLVMDEIRRAVGDNPEPEALKAALLDLAGRALHSEHEHILNRTRDLIDTTEEKLDSRLEETEETLDLFLEGLEDIEDESQRIRSPQELQTEMSTLLRVPLKLPVEELRKIINGDGQEVRQEIVDQLNEQLITLNVRRLYGALERSLGKGSLKAGMDNLNTRNWQEATDQMLQAVEDLFAQRQSRLLGEEGEISRDLDKALKELSDDPLSDPSLVQFLSLMAIGTRLAFSDKTHQRIQLRYTRMQYIYLAAHLVETSEPEEISERVVQHLEEALQVLEEVRGRFQWNQLKKVNATLGQLDERLQKQLKETLGSEKFEQLAGLSLFDFNDEDRQLVSEVLGRRLQNDAYRQLLLHIISNQWVEYLTQVEALRIQVGMERYAQRDPLVEYKSKATDMFKQLLKNIRLGVVSQAFTFRPRAIAVESSDHTAGKPEPEPAGQPAETGGKRHKKRKRH
jgi:preprotein translocase subunit SecA